MIGYWLPLIILGPLTMWAMQGFQIVGLLLFWVIQIIVFIVSWKLSGESCGEWFKIIALCGVRQIGLAMTKLSREYVGKKERESWEIKFAIWWGFSIKFFVPFALWMLICFSLKADLDVPYGGYHPFW